MGEHLETTKRTLDPEAFDDFKRRTEDILPMREEVFQKFKDIIPKGWDANIGLETCCMTPYIVRWIRKQPRWDVETYYEFSAQSIIEWMCRTSARFHMAKRAADEKPPVTELYKPEWTGYFSNPPTYLVRPDLSFATTQLLYGKYATMQWSKVNYFNGEIHWCGGYHLEDGLPAQFWMAGIHERYIPYITDEQMDAMCGITPLPGETGKFKFVYPTSCGGLEMNRSASELPQWRMEITKNMERRHLRLGVKFMETPKKLPYDAYAWTKPIRDILMDVREEQFPRWTHATLYVAVGPGIMADSTQNNFWGMSQWWNDPYYCMKGTLIMGYPIQYYNYNPLPPILNTLLALPREAWTRRLAELYFTGPEGLLLDGVTKLNVPEEWCPMLYDLRDVYLKGEAYKDFAIPYDDGIPPPTAFITSIPSPFYKEGNIRDFITNPEKLPKEYWDVLESEGGMDKESGRIPPYNEVPRLKWLFDPTIEWLKPKDFPPIDWKKGQVWPYDVTHEKMEIMVEEGYDGSGTDILHYSALADKKMGRKGKIILLGTMSYKLPTE